MADRRSQPPTGRGVPRGAVARAARLPLTVFAATSKRLYLTLRHGATELLFERRHGLQTSSAVDLESLGLAGAERNRYKPAGWLMLRRILPRRAVGADDVFIDIGSGKGRVVFQAAQRYRLRRVIGLELSEELNAVARENIAGHRDRLRCTDVELITGDVLEVDVPDDVTIAFLNNPFTGDVFGAALAKLIDSVDRNPRRLRIVYANPVEHERLMASGRVRTLRRVRGWRPSHEWSRSNSARMYEILPGASPAASARVRRPYGA